MQKMVQFSIVVKTIIGILLHGVVSSKYSAYSPKNSGIFSILNKTLNPCNSVT